MYLNGEDSFKSASERIQMDRLAKPSAVAEEGWIYWLDLFIEGGILLFILLFPVKTFIIPTSTISILKWMALYIPLMLWLLKMLVRRDFSLIRTPIDRPLFLYAVVVVASVLYSIDRMETVSGIRGSFIKAAVLYLVILNNFQTIQKTRRLAVAFAASFLITIGIGFYNYQLGEYNVAGGITAFANEHHNIMGKILGGSFPFLLLTFSMAKKPIWKGMSFLLVILGLFGIFMTLSRATWAGAVVAFLIWGMHQNRKLTLSALVLFLFSLFTFGPDPVAERFALIEDQMNSMSGRTPIWEVAVKQVKERPLLGYGYGLNIFTKVYEEGREDPPGEGPTVQHEHNLFLSLLIQTGLVGTLLFLWIFIGTLVLIIRAIYSMAAGWDREILIILMSGMVGEYFVHAMLDRNNVGNWALPLWVMIAIAMAILYRTGGLTSKTSPSQVALHNLPEMK
ncbi:MAG: O-antigen ligase family protein [Candidatus Manganitrophus sp.]|nr:O-antigen ligase family protein [Candidatus Manganitrophus sp.]MDC4223292.1 O-antigen ligase family protein [Candidatus Manganitrophus sp.]WDT71607.1 MAG: O-antigen ligase family protein [Candidatus Manganitrophus sp.]WDT76143.1 MAG: O-antigen ligase family protein [Candidatus Manganitrophus sp.]WDT81046.1 MAG: O-antigen ligase family protein [Candidatus Manganitrophus sp.]